MEFDICYFMMFDKFDINLLLIFLGFCPVILEAQSTSLDSLKSTYVQEFKDSTKVEILARIGDTYYEENFDSTIFYYQKAFHLSEKIPYYDVQLSSLRSLGYVYSFQKNDFDTALVFFNKAIDLSKAESDSVAIAYVLSDIGRIYWKQGKSVEALKYHLQVKKLGEKINHPKILLRSNLSLGIIENEDGNNAKAKQYYHHAYQIADSLKRDRSKGLILNNLGKAFQDEEEFDDAYLYFQKADSIFTKLNDSGRRSLANYNLGKNFCLLEKVETGIEFYNIALEHNKKIGNQEREVMILSGLALAYQKLNKHQHSISTAEKALRMLKQIDTKLYYDEIYKTLGDSYESVGNNFKSVQNYKHHFEYKNKYNKVDRTKKIASLNYAYELEKKEKKLLEFKNKDLETEKKLILTKINLHKMVFAFFSFFLFSAILFYRAKVFEYKKIDNLRSNLSKNLHDNIGTSLNHIKLLSKRMNKKMMTKSETQTTIIKIKQISDELIYNMYDMVWSLNTKKESLGNLLERIQDYADNILPDFDIPFQFEIDSLNKKKILTVQQKINIYLIFKESVNNIIKHTKAEKVIFSFKKEQNKLFKMSISSFYSEKKEPDELSNKQGISNMMNRAEEIGGELKIHECHDNFRVEFYI
ncbi:MAG: tetratricopeptide repeat protein [Saprospiraceae bacterium]